MSIYQDFFPNKNGSVRAVLAFVAVLTVTVLAMLSWFKLTFGARPAAAQAPAHTRTLWTERVGPGGVTKVEVDGHCFLLFWGKVGGVSSVAEPCSFPP